MAFAVTCKSCQARFLLNDDLLRRKVAGRVVTVRCRQCHAPIEVDASQVDVPKAADKPEPPGPPPPPPLKATLAYKPAPAPPRPTKSATLMGIGGPPRPGAAPEMVALSPGLLNVSAPAPGPHGFPEPPPPPSSVEELSGDWEIPEAETPLMTAAEPAPESVDDFAEELPPSLPPPASEEPPVSLDVDPPSIDISSFDAPLTGKETLPLFGVDDAAPKLSPPTVDQLSAPPKPPEGSLSPAAIDHPAPSSRPDSSRERRNVVAPPTHGERASAPSSRRSVLAVPVLLVLAAAAGFLIWKRSNATPEQPVATTEPTVQTPVAPVAAPELAAAAEPPAVAAATTTTPPEDDVTFETTPQRPAEKAEKVAAAPSEPKPQTPSSTEPAAPAKTQAEAPAEPVTPAPKEEPKPAVPSEPAGPFDRAAAAAALTAAASAASTCRKEGDPSGTASVVITFAPSGRVTSANLSGPPFAGTPTGGCIAAALRQARVPPFEGDRVTVSKTIVVQ